MVKEDSYDSPLHSVENALLLIAFTDTFPNNVVLTALLYKVFENNQVCLSDQIREKPKVKGLIALANNLGVQYCLTDSSINSVLNWYLGKTDVFYTNNVLNLLTIKNNAN